MDGPSRRSKTIHTLFGLTLLGKAFDGLVEVLGGLGLFFVNPAQLNWLLWAATRRELREDPQDAIANFLLSSGQHLATDTRLFVALFLLWHGVVKLGLVWALRRRQKWAYSTAMAAFTLFLGYQVYRYSHTRSTWLLVLSLLDLFMILLTWLEYRRLLGELAFRTAEPSR
jgi:uncharacterized membrane protein